MVPTPILRRMKGPVTLKLLRIRMENHVDLGETKCAYTLMDIREMDART